MKRDLELWEFVSRSLTAGRNVVLLVTAKSSGSSPGRQGFKMAVARDGMCGSIGGGVMEVSLVDKARALLKAGSQPAFITEQTHRKGSNNPSGMICSGTQTIIFKLLTPDDDVTVVQSIVGALKSRKAAELSITMDEFKLKDSDDAATVTFESRSETDFIYREFPGAKNEIYIIGGGHCALALSELMSKLDFYVRIFDDRPELNTIGKNTFADEIHILDNYDQIGEKVSGGENAYVVVMTIGFISDEIVIRCLLDKTFRYFGVLGSKAKMTTLLRNLQHDGCSKETLAAIHTPIGLPINSQTPEEIAISIAAEIISIKNGPQ